MAPTDVLEVLGAIQLDSVNSVGRNHELVVFSRSGPHDPADVRAAVYGGQGFEYWGHSASWLPLADYPLFLHRIAKLRDSGRGASTVNAAVRDEHPELYGEVLRRIEADGPVETSDFADERGGSGGWWRYRPVKQVLEDLFDSGEVMCCGRTTAFGRQYDLTERVLPGWVPREDPGVEASLRELMIRSVRRLGVASYGEMKDYYRCHKWKEPWRAALDDVVADGTLATVTVDGLRGPHVALPSALETPPEPPIHRPVLLSPLDSLLWDRPRVLRLFDFEHTFEIYKRAETRRYGYWVMPLLAGGRLQGRADLKLDRSRSVLEVRGAWLDGAAPDDMARALGDLATHLSASLEVIDRSGSDDAVVRNAIRHSA